MIQLYTIGFTKKPAETFFTLLKDSGIDRLIDTRINNVSQLSGFAKGTDLKYFAGELANVPTNIILISHLRNSFCRFTELKN